MNIMQKLENKWDAQTNTLSDKEKQSFNKLKSIVFDGYALIKPIIIAIFMYSIFFKVYKTIGFNDTIIVLLITILIFLRQILAKK